MATFHRLNLKLATSLIDKIDAIREITAASSRTEVIRNAIAFYHATLCGDGDRIVTVRWDDKPRNGRK